MNMTALPEEVVRLATGRAIAHVATLLADGSPHSVPVWIGLEDGRLVFLTSPGTQKARNLSRDPRVAISMVDSEDPARMAMVRGRVGHPVEGPAAWQIIDRISQRYIGQPYPVRSDRVVFLVHTEQALAASYG